MNEMIQSPFAKHWVFRIVFGVVCRMGQLLYISLNLLALGIGVMVAAGLRRGRCGQQLPERTNGLIYPDYTARTRRFLPGVY